MSYVSGRFVVTVKEEGFPGGSDGKESACNAGDLGSILGWGRSPGGGHGNPDSSILAWRIPMDRVPWQATVHRGGKESDTTERPSAGGQSSDTGY